MIDAGSSAVGFTRNLNLLHILHTRSVAECVGGLSMLLDAPGWKRFHAFSLWENVRKVKQRNEQGILPFPTAERKATTYGILSSE